ncbi:GIY-YIG nuclease family protein [Erythrobacter aurantius]|uniref:GIY-YIG nuclease family protein n=1 Tax=Erythrobacter aurantius TaxID=2909249 RepID=UPI002079C02D|nr:GIY-YIG nuclease family protein [Erythrobacter aurantius]
MNWTGHILVTPRSKLAEALKRDEPKRAGVYILEGDDPGTPGKALVYIGEGDNIGERLKAHAKDPNKEFWDRAFLITSKDPNLTKSHVRYLENRLVQIATAVQRASIANGNEPQPKALPESDAADMEFFLSRLQIVLPVVGLNALRPKPKAKAASSSATETGVSDDNLELTLESKKYGLEATAVEANNEVTVLAGSSANKKADYAVNMYSSIRDSLVADGSLAEKSDDLLIFTKDVTFNSPSAAAAVIYNRNANGRTSWRIKGTSMTLKDWQDKQLDSVAT